MPLSPGEILLPNVLSAVARETDPEYRATIRKFSTVREYSRKFIVGKAPFEIRLFSFNRRNVGWYAGTRPPKNARRKFEYNNRCIYPNTLINFSRRCARHPRVKNVNKASFLTRLSLPVPPFPSPFAEDSRREFFINWHLIDFTDFPFACRRNFIPIGRKILLLTLLSHQTRPYIYRYDKYFRFLDLLETRCTILLKSGCRERERETVWIGWPKSSPET